MNTKDDGGPAFPVPEMHFAPNTKQACESQGMSLRDWFAGMAIQGLLAHLVGVKGGAPKEYGKRAYEYADALLAARKEEA